jgi:hypothetical protein
MDNCIDGTGHPPEVHGVITMVWAGCSPGTTSFWFVSGFIGRGCVAALPIKAVELFIGKKATLYLLPNGIVTAISGISTKETR